MRYSGQLKTFLFSFLFCIMFTGQSIASQNILKDSLLRSIQRDKNPSNVAECYIRLSEIYSKSDFRLSVEYARMAVDFAEKSGSNHLIGSSYKTLGLAVFNCNDYIYALGLFLKARDIFLADSNEEELFSVYLMLGNLYSRIYDNNAAMECYQSALNLCEKDDSSKKMHSYLSPSVYANIGVVYFGMGDNISAEEYTQKAIDMSEKCGSSDLGIYYLNLANILIAQKNYTGANDVLVKAEAICKSSDNRLDMAGFELTMSSFKISTGDYDGVYEYLDDVIVTGLELESPALLKEAYYLRGSLHEKKENFETALSDYRKSQEYSAKLLDAEKAYTLQKLQYASEFQMKEKELLDKNRNTLNKMWGFAGISLILIIIIILVILLIKVRIKSIQNEKANLEKDLELKNKELISKVLFLMEKNETINSVTDKLVQLRNSLSDKSDKELLQQSIIDLKNAAEESLFKSFETYFNNVYESFYANLKKDFDHLTQSDLRMCAFLRLNLSSKEISSLLNQSVGSIDVSRSRLRKKLGLVDSSENLVEFLSQY